jgi:hypothetical protein
VALLRAIGHFEFREELALEATAVDPRSSYNLRDASHEAWRRLVRARLVAGDMAGAGAVCSAVRKLTLREIAEWL